MCGIVAAATRRNVSGILLEGLQRLEYRGYDSAGMALLSEGIGLLDGRLMVSPQKKMLTLIFQILKTSI